MFICLFFGGARGGGSGFSLQELKVGLVLVLSGICFEFNESL